MEKAKQEFRDALDKEHTAEDVYLANETVANLLAWRDAHKVATAHMEAVASTRFKRIILSERAKAEHWFVNELASMESRAVAPVVVISPMREVRPTAAGVVREFALTLKGG